VWLVRHGETEWSLSGRHTGRTDVPLTKNGERQAAHLGERLRARSFALVLTSPLRRAAHTCELAGFGDRRQLDPDLVEWDYGAYEGRRTVEIRAERSQWDLFRDGCPGGESPRDLLDGGFGVRQRGEGARETGLVHPEKGSRPV